MSVLHALLIGIDDYVPGRLPGGVRYPSLHGATRDVDRVESLLRDQGGLAAERTRKLLSRIREDGVPTEPPERRPTYANLVAAFKRLATEAEPGDRVYVHYSGHGAQLPTEFPEVKGTKGKDEALVPCDIGEPGSRYLRDLELAVLVRLLVDRGLAVTLVLDCCHSGGALRTAPPCAVPRKVPGVPLPPDPSAVAARDLLIRAWRSLQKEDVRRRNVSAQSWLPVARYALFAACRPDELAYEYPFEKEEPQGALTYWLLESLKKGGFEQRCDAVRNTLVAGVHGKIAFQTPLFAGDGERPFLGGRPSRGPRPPSPEGPLVLRVDQNGRVLLSWGQAQGARARARLILKGSVLQVRQVGAAESWAEVVKGPKPSAIRPGTPVDVLPLQAVVRLLPPAPGDGAAEKALQLLRETLWDYRGGLVEVDDEAEAPDLCVAIDAQGCYEIRDPAGSAFPNLAPLRTNDRGAAWEVVRRLEHLAKYRGLRTLENPEAPHLGIGLELCGDDPSADPVPVPSGGLDLKCDEAVILRIVNRSSMRLDFAVLDLAPDYSVTQILPPRGSFSLLPLDAGEGHVLRIRGALPPELQEGVDVLKVFATRGSVSYRGMQLPPLGKRDPSLIMRGELTPSEFPEEEWISAQVEIRVTR